jgi:polyisoprenyl-teichoic acid--peptidoglycan teichoic acid transferase
LSKNGPTRRIDTVRRTGIDKSVLLLIVIIAIVAGTVVLVITYVRTDAIVEGVEADELISVLVGIDLGDGRLITEVFYYQPGTHRGALFDIPANTGVVLETLNRVDSVDAAYFSGDAESLRDEVASLLGEPILYYIVLDRDQFSAVVDFVEGVNVFAADVPNEGPDAVMIPDGDVVLDGAKAYQYVAYTTQDERDRERIARHQRFVIGLLERFGEEAHMFSSYAASRVMLSEMDTNLERRALVSLMTELDSLEADRVITRQVEGSVRSVEIDDATESLLFPHQEGRWLLESVRQVVDNLTSEDAIRDENIVIRIEILNGTEVTGLASRTAALYRSYGFDVVAVGNADESGVERTMIIDRHGNETFARRTADIIQAPGSAIVVDVDSQSAVDVTIILGKDFDQQYVR